MTAITRKPRPGDHWVPPTQDLPSPPPPPAEPARVQMGLEPGTLEQMKDLEIMFRDLEPAITGLAKAINRLHQELEEAKELIRESRGPAADPGSRGEPEGAAGAGDPV